MRRRNLKPHIGRGRGADDYKALFMWAVQVHGRLPDPPRDSVPPPMFERARMELTNSHDSTRKVVNL